ncbi:anti-sigma factor family protein [Duffyella gerundensis]|uniref:anti-sigma factor family protein n=1 Tax=Duffyella gerundensis TaxID=1619313 RepID=UPI001654554F|nr:anti-sigma factor [Duffyella gerundensis]
MTPGEQELHAWMDGEVDDARAEKIERYLAENPQIAAEMAALRQDKQLLRQAMHRQPPYATNVDAHYFHRRLRQQRFRKLALACVLVLSVGIGGITGWQISAQMNAHLPMEDAVQAFRLFGDQSQLPLDVSAAQQADLTRWVTRYFIHGDLPPNLEQYGFKPLGARLMATAQGPAALVMYEDPHGTRLAWYIRPLSPIKMSHGERQAEDVMAQYWSDAHYNYALVTPLGAPQAGVVRKALSPTIS